MTSNSMQSPGGSVICITHGSTGGNLETAFYTGIVKGLLGY